MKLLVVSNSGPVGKWLVFASGVLIAGLIAMRFASLKAASPATGTLSDSSGQLTWTGSTLASAPLFDPASCQTGQNCDVFTVSVNISDAYRSANPNFVVFVRIDWASTANDFDLHVRKDGNTIADSGQGFTTFEEVRLDQPANGAYQVVTHSFATAPATSYAGKITLLTEPPAVLYRTASYVKDP